MANRHDRRRGPLRVDRVRVPATARGGLVLRWALIIRIQRRRGYASPLLDHFEAAAARNAIDGRSRR